MKKKYSSISSADKDFIRKNRHLSNAVIARRIGCSMTAVAYQRNKMKVPLSIIRWDKRQISRLAKYLREGYSIPEIAELFHTSVTNIYSRIRLIKKNGSKY